MSKHKKKDKKHKDDKPPADGTFSEVERLREENEALRARLERIAELAGEPPVEKSAAAAHVTEL